MVGDGRNPCNLGCKLFRLVVCQDMAFWVLPLDSFLDRRVDMLRSILCGNKQLQR